VERIPILKMGEFLLVTIQVDMHDRLALTLQDDLTEMIVKHRAHGVLIDISALEVVDSFIGRMLGNIASVSRVLDAATPFVLGLGRQRRLGLAVVFVTHDLGVAAEIADEAAVMYAGRIVEQAPIGELFARPAHPYTESLMQATVRRGQRGIPLVPIPGAPPNLAALPAGCAFAARCRLVREECRTTLPPLYQVRDGHVARCHLVPERFGASPIPKAASVA